MSDNDSFNGVSFVSILAAIDLLQNAGLDTSSVSMSLSFKLPNKLEKEDNNE